MFSVSFEDDRSVYTPSSLNQRVKMIIESDSILKQVSVSGEISNLRYYERGDQLYFNLVDSHSSLNCVMFSSSLSHLKFEPKNGDKVTALGTLSVFHKRGTYSLQTFTIEREGDGQLSKAFEKLKKDLEKEGLFSPDRKQPLPSYPRRIGLITAAPSAAFTDFSTILSQHQLPVDIALQPATMQGVFCAASVCDALDQLQTQSNLDLVVITRGGGSQEDLAGFNDERLVRRVADFPLPVLSAIGHEVDITLLDFVADFRAATPTAAAEKLTSPFLLARRQVLETTQRLRRLWQVRRHDVQQHIASSLNESLAQLQRHYEKHSQRALELSRRLSHANPLYKLKQGFSITRTRSGEPVSTIDSVTQGALIETIVEDGIIESEVICKKKKTFNPH